MKFFSRENGAQETVSSLVSSPPAPSPPPPIQRNSSSVLHIRVTSKRFAFIIARQQAPDINEKRREFPNPPATPFVAAKLPVQPPLWGRGSRRADTARTSSKQLPSFTASRCNSSTQLIPNGGAREQDNAPPLSPSPLPPPLCVAASRAKPTPLAISVPTGLFL